MVPVGFVPLVAALDMVGRRLYGASWYPFSAGPLDPLDLVRDVDAIDAESITATLNAFEHVITLIAERAASGELPCIRSSIHGVESLNPGVWHSPGWCDYFIAGKVTLPVPLRDEKGKVVRLRDAKGKLRVSTVRGTFDIFVERKGLERLIATLEPTLTVPASDRAVPKQATEKQLDGLLDDYVASVGDDPAKATLDGFRAFAQDSRLGPRDQVDAAYRKRFPGRRPGPRRQSARK
jgi:hypothetical protein